MSNVLTIRKGDGKYMTDKRHTLRNWLDECSAHDQDLFAKEYGEVKDIGKEDINERISLAHALAEPMIYKKYNITKT